MASIIALISPKPSLKSFLKLPNPKFSSKTDLFWRRKNMMVVMVGALPEKGKYSGDMKAFVEEMRSVAMKLHAKNHAREGERESEGPALADWEPSVDGYLRFLVDSKVVYDVLEGIVQQHTFSHYAYFRNTGLERSKSLAKDLEWFESQGYTIPKPSSPGVTYAKHLKELSKEDSRAFICHLCNIYFAHSTGGRMIGKKVAEKVLDRKKLEFYKWEGDHPQSLQNVKDMLNKVAEDWTREERNHCLEETEKSFMYWNEILRLILSWSPFRAAI